MIEGERIQKYLASMGVASRRDIERLVEEGRIQVNGKVAHIGQKVTEADRIAVDGRPVQQSRAVPHQYVAYNKPEGEVCTRRDPEGRPTVFDHLPRLAGRRWVNVGRLDVNTSGLVLFTTDGALANGLMHPSRQIHREYAVRVRGHVTEDMVKRLVTGVDLEDGKARFEDVTYHGGPGQNQWFYVLVAEGRNRLVRRLWESQGVTVSRLKRVRYGAVSLSPSLREGMCKALSSSEVAELYASCGLEVAVTESAEGAFRKPRSGAPKPEAAAGKPPRGEGAPRNEAGAKLDRRKTAAGKPPRSAGAPRPEPGAKLDRRKKPGAGYSKSRTVRPQK